MKKICGFVFLTGLSVASLLAQGTVDFINVGNTIDAPIYSTDGTTPLGAGYSVQLYYAAGVVTDSSSLTLLGASTTPFAGAGYFIGGEQTLPLATGSTATLQVRAWRNSDGANWAVASGTVGAWVGQSGLLTVSLGGPNPPNPTITPSELTGMTSFSLYQVVPEPSTVALGVLAVGSLLFIRRRK